MNIDELLQELTNNLLYEVNEYEKHKEYRKDYRSRLRYYFTLEEQLGLYVYNYYKGCISSRKLVNISELINDNISNLNVDIFTHYYMKVDYNNNIPHYIIYQENNGIPIYIQLYNNSEQHKEDFISNNKIIIYIELNELKESKDTFIYYAIKYHFKYVINKVCKYNINYVLQRNELNNILTLYKNIETNNYKDLKEYLQNLNNNEIIKYCEYKVYQDFMIYYNYNNILNTYHIFEFYVYKINRLYDNQEYLPIFLLGKLLQKHYLIYNKVTINDQFINHYIECCKKSDRKSNSYKHKYQLIALYICDILYMKASKYRTSIYNTVSEVLTKKHINFNPFKYYDNSK